MLEPIDVSTFEDGGFKKFIMPEPIYNVQRWTKTARWSVRWFWYRKILRMSFYEYLQKNMIANRSGC